MKKTAIILMTMIIGITVLSGYAVPPLMQLPDMREIKSLQSYEVIQSGEISPSCKPPQILPSRHPCPGGLAWKKTRHPKCRTRKIKNCGTYYYRVMGYLWKKDDGTRGYCEDDAYYDSAVRCSL